VTRRSVRGRTLKLPSGWYPLLVRWTRLPGLITMTRRLALQLRGPGFPDQANRSAPAWVKDRYPRQKGYLRPRHGWNSFLYWQSGNGPIIPSE
jgi:hypothetical protein